MNNTLLVKLSGLLTVVGLAILSSTILMQAETSRSQGAARPRRVAAAAESPLVAVGDGIPSSSFILPDARPQSARQAGVPMYVGGAALAVVASGENLYASVGKRLVTFDATDLTRPVRIGASAAMPDFASRMAIAGDYAYVVSGQGWLRGFDVSDPTAPVESWAITETLGTVSDLAVSDGYAYVLADGVLHILDLSNPLVPVERGVYTETLQTATSVYAAGSSVYVVDATSLHIIDVTDPSAPIESGSYWGTLQSPADVFVSDGYAYVADLEVGLRIIDVRDPAAMSEVGSLAIPGSLQIVVQGNLAFVAEARWRWQHDAWVGVGLHIIRVEDPAQPSQVGYLSTPDFRDLTMSGSIVYLAAYEDGLRIINVSDPAQPAEIAWMDTMLHDRRVALPALGRSECQARVIAQNLGSIPSRFALLLWGAPSSCPPQAAGPFMVMASPIVSPGSRFAFDGLPPGAHSAFIYSFSTEDVDGDSISDADEAINRFFEPELSFDAWRREDVHLRQAGITTGGEPMGSPMAVTVERTCPGNLNPAVTARADYAGISDRVQGQPDEDQEYAYAVPLLWPTLDAPPADMATYLYIQNVGIACTSVGMRFQARDDCLTARGGGIPALAPGDSFTVDVNALAGPAFEGTAWIEASQPLAIVAEHVGQDLRMSSVAQPVSMAWMRGYASPAYQDYNGWDTEIQVQNLSPVVNAKVKVTFFDASGDIVGAIGDWICPRGSSTVFLPDINWPDWPSEYVGTALIESEDRWSPEDPGVDVPNLVSVVNQVKCAEADCTTLLEAASFEVMPAPPPDPRRIPLATENLLVAAPVLAQDSQLVVQNDNADPGTTLVRVDLYPPDGVPAICSFELGPKQNVALNLWEYLRQGSDLVAAVIRAGETSQAGGPMLSATVQECAGRLSDPDIPGDSTVAYTGPWLATDYQAPVGALDCMAPYLSVAPDQIVAEMIAGEVQTITRTLTITNANIFGPELAWEVETDAGWVTAEPITGTTPATITVTLDMSNLPVGHHTAGITVLATTPGTYDSPQVVPIEATISTPTPTATPTATPTVTATPTATVGSGLYLPVILKDR